MIGSGLEPHLGILASSEWNAWHVSRDPNAAPTGFTTNKLQELQTQQLWHASVSPQKVCTIPLLRTVGTFIYWI